MAMPEKTAEMNSPCCARVAPAAAGNRTRVWIVPAHVHTTHGQDGAVALDIFQGQVFRLNHVGSRIFELLKQGLSETATAEQLACEFEICPARAQGDVRDFVATLEKHQLLIASSEQE